jgi:hypothetical protein
MTTSTATAKFELNVRVTNKQGSWATLRFDPSGGYQPGLGPIGIYYAEAWAPVFAEGIGSHVLAQGWDRAKVERSMRNWLKPR